MDAGGRIRVHLGMRVKCGGHTTGCTHSHQDNEMDVKGLVLSVGTQEEMKHITGNHLCRLKLHAHKITLDKSAWKIQSVIHSIFVAREVEMAQGNAEWATGCRE